MVVVTVDNSYSTVKGLSPKDEKALRDALSYIVGGKSSYFSKYGPTRKSLLSKRGEFPTGLLRRLLDSLVSYGCNINLVDNRFKAPYKPRQPSKSSKPYSWQVSALKAAVAAGRGIISATTGSGKSRVIHMLAHYYGLPTLVVVPSLGIKKQLQETLKDLTNVTVENVDSPALKKPSKLKFDLLIIDEAHHVAARTYQKLNKTAWSGIGYRFFLSATPYRNDTEETLLFESIAGELVYELTYNEAVKNGYIVQAAAFCIEIPKKQTAASTYAQVYSQLVVNNSDRNDQIAYLLLKLNQAESPTLCLVREVAHGRILSDLTGVPFVNGVDEESRDYIRQFNAGEIKALIGTTGVIGEGIDTKPAEFVIIAGLGKAKSQFMQQIGRVLRQYPGKEYGKVILIKDKSHKFLIRHYNAQVAILREEYGVLPVKLEIK